MRHVLIPMHELLVSARELNAAVRGSRVLETRTLSVSTVGVQHLERCGSFDPASVRQVELQPSWQPQPLLLPPVLLQWWWLLH
jgi:hypothetical protein